MHWNLQCLYKVYSTLSTSKESFCCRTGTFTTPFHYIKGTVLRIFAICAKDFLLVCLLGVKQTTYFYMALKTSLKAPENQLQGVCSATSSKTEGDFDICGFILNNCAQDNYYNCWLTSTEIFCLFKFSSAVQKGLV